MSLLIDLAIIGTIIAFASSGGRLGIVVAGSRLASSLVAFLVAVLLHDVGARIVHAITFGMFSRSLSALVALLGIGIGTYHAAAILVRWITTSIDLERLDAHDRTGGIVAGGLLGMLWAGLMASLLVLMPADNVISRGAVESRSGSVMVTAAPGAMQWLLDTFPRHAQALPKGRGGATLEQRSTIPVRSEMRRRRDPDSAGRLLASINRYREDEGRGQLQWNVDLADVAYRHSSEMFIDGLFSTTGRDGAEVTDRMRAALGANAGRYDTFVARVVWAHSVGNAYEALIDDRKARRELLGRSLIEVGIGAVDGGWFNGQMYTICIVGEAGVGSAANAGGSEGSIGTAAGDDVGSG